MIDYSRILSTFYTGKTWVLNGESYEGLDWFDSEPKPTKEELDSQWEEVLSIRQKDQCETQAQKLLNESDFADLYSVRNSLKNIDEWDNYRNTIRQFKINPIENPVFPDKPKTIWKEV